MEIDLPGLITVKQWKRLTLLIFSAAFFAFGIALIIIGATMDDPIPTLKSNKQEDPGLTIYLGCLHLIVGMGGIAATLLKSRILLMIVTGIVVFEVIVDTANTGFFMQFLFDRSMPPELDDMEQDVFMQYGNNETDAQFTDTINRFHVDEQCCGWSGSDERNIYVLTQWYERVNAGKPEGKKPKVLPDSCCITVSEDCVTTRSLKEAREKNLIHKKDCLLASAWQMKLVVLIARIKYVFFYFIEVAFMIISVMYIVQDYREQS